jgi:hypothetical protein
MALGAHPVHELGVDGVAHRQLKAVHEVHLDARLLQGGDASGGHEGVGVPHAHHHLHPARRAGCLAHTPLPMCAPAKVETRSTAHNS